MGNVGSRPDDPAALYVKDQARFTLSALTITNSRGATLMKVSPNAFPATRVAAHRESGDDRPVEYIQDTEPPSSSSPPSFLLRLSNDDELHFKFTFGIRQTQLTSAQVNVNNGVATTLPGALDTTIRGLTFAHASNAKELDNLITREFHANPNLQNNANVAHVGDFSTGGNPSVQYDWTWKWKPPKLQEDKGGGWRNCCSFLEYDQRTNRLNTIASFTFWMQNVVRPPLASPTYGSGYGFGFELGVPQQRGRVFSAQSGLSGISRGSDVEGMGEVPPSPIEFIDPVYGSAPTYAPPPPPTLHTIPSISTTSASATSPAPAIAPINCSRPREDMSTVDDGPVFRATMKALEQKTGNMRIKLKKVLKKAEAVHATQNASNDAMNAFIGALNDAATSNANAIQPALEHYFEKIAREILLYETGNTRNLQKMVIEPLSKLYNNDIKQADSKKKDFEDESRDYYAYLGRYLGQRQDSLKEKKRVESDSKYQTKRRNFELKRFDYSSFMHDLHGGRKEHELLYHLTKYADIQAMSYLKSAKKIEEMVPQFEALKQDVSEADKEYQFQRVEREEKRRALEKSTTKYVEPENATNPGPPLTAGSSGHGHGQSDSELGRADSTSSQLKGVISNSSATGSGFSGSAVGSVSGQNRFKGIRDLEERDASADRAAETAHKKQGLLWALSKPGSHIDPKGINKQAWHKFWIVLDGGKLSEHSNWKQKLDLHMEPIDLRMASVREARNQERRFCFEVITPQYKRIYQATSEEDMGNWITAINNALQSAVEGRVQPPVLLPSPQSDSTRRDIGSVLTGKSSSHSDRQSDRQGYTTAATNNVNRRTTVGARPGYVRTDSHGYAANPSQLLQDIRAADQGNNWCADCGSSSKVEWVSINLGIVLCIECSGIHRSLGTHISKIRSLTLDIQAFSNDIVEILLQIGNRVSNMVWESKLDSSQKPTGQSTREQRLKYITAKYSERAFVQPLSSTLSRYSSAEETLLASIKKNDIQGVLYAIALRANLNAADRSRNTHAVYLALAAADPAPLTTTPTKSNSPVEARPFPIAELIMQNGAEIPTQLPAIPLSPAAQLYVNQRTGRVTQSQASANAPSTGSMSSDGDKLSALPTIPVTGGIGVEPKERERLHKRGSAGARFAGRFSGSLDK